MNAQGPIVIGWTQLAIATLFIVVTIGLSAALHVGVAKRFALAAVRTYIQLLALGLVLGWVFSASSAWVVVAILVVMTGVAASTVTRRAPDAPRGLFITVFCALLAVGSFITFTVTAVIIGVQPWYEPRYVIPIAGMVLGNSMNGIALALERTFADLDARADEVLAFTALGATPWEAAAPSVRTALRAGMIPGINSLSVAGIVFIPGMMACQVLAGADPMVAAPYQIVVMLMISTADVCGTALTVLLTFRRRFTPEGIYLERGLRNDPH